MTTCRRRRDSARRAPRWKVGSVNKVILIGNLGADPELRHLPSGISVCGLRIATTENWKDQSGIKQEKTEWHRVTAWGATGENCAKYLSKGRSVYIEGRLQTTKYEKDGQTRYSTDITATHVVFLGGGKDAAGYGASGDGPPKEDAFSPPPPPASDDDIPF